MATIINLDKKTSDSYRQELLEMGDGKTPYHLLNLLKSRYKLIYVQSSEESRVIECLRNISLSEGFNVYQWDCSRGLLDCHTKKQVKSQNNEVHRIPGAIISHIIDQAKVDNKELQQDNLTSEGHIFALLDFHVNLSAPLLQRQLKEFAGISSITTIIIVAPVLQVPDTLEKDFTIVDFPFPSRKEIKSALSRIKKELPSNYPAAHQFANEHESDLIDAAQGLTLAEAEGAFALSIVKHKTFHIPTILAEKKQIIRKTGILEFCTPRFTFDQVGGLDVLKEWLKVRKMGFTEEAREFGIPPMKGILLAGVPGCGKSLICDALAHYYEMPLLRLDMGSIFQSLVGQSEQNMRLVIKAAECVSPCLLFVDEIEKGISGAQGQTRDGGTTQRVFGTLLTWLQEKEKPVFLVCTANNVESLPPEFMRAGRFDEIFFVDLPNEIQRRDVISKLLTRYKRNPASFDIARIARSCDFYSPAEIEKGICNGLFTAFADDRRELTTDDIVVEIGKFQPLYNTRQEDIERMREWAIGEDGKGGRAVLANATTDGESYVSSRKLSLKECDL